MRFLNNETKDPPSFILEIPNGVRTFNPFPDNKWELLTFVFSFDENGEPSGVTCKASHFTNLDNDEAKGHRLHVDDSGKCFWFPEENPEKKTELKEVDYIDLMNIRLSALSEELNVIKLMYARYLKK